MKTPLHVLMVEDSTDDARLVLRALDRHGYEVIAQRVDTAPDFRAALARPDWEIVLSDYALPAFGGEEALRIVRESGRDIPFIFVSGTIGEEVAVAAMKAGAHDYVMKHNLARLAPAVARELSDALERRRRRAAEAQMEMSEHKYRHLFQRMSDAALLVAEADGRVIDANEQAGALFGLTRDQLLGRPVGPLIPPLVSDPAGAPWPGPDGAESEIRKTDGAAVPVHVTVSHITLDRRRFLLALFRDITVRRRAEEALRASQQAFLSLVNTVDGIVWEADATSFRFTFVSAQAERILGYPPAAWQQQPDFWSAHLHPDDRENAVNYCVTATREKRDHQFLYRMIAADGRVVWIHDLVTVVVEDDRPVRLRGLMVDITERKIAEEAMRVREHEFQALVENAPDAICRFDGGCRIAYTNPAYAQVLGVPASDLLGRTPTEVYPGQPSVAHYEEKIRAVLATGISVQYEITLEALQRPNPPCYDIRLVPERDHEGRVTSVLSIGRDITALKETERRWRTLTENSPDYIARFDREARFLYSNPVYAAMCAQLGVAPFGRTPLEIFPPVPSVRLFQEKVREVAASGRAVGFEVVLDALPEQKPPCHFVRLEPEHDDSGRVVSVLAIGRDISAIKETERQLRSLAENSPDIILRFDRAGRYLFVNQAMERATGLPATCFIGRTVGEIAGVNNVPAVAERFRLLGVSIQRVVATSQASEEEMRLAEPDGERIFNLRLIPETDGTGRVDTVLVLAREVTARQRAEEALRASEQRFRQVTENIDEVFWLTDVAKSAMIYISPAYERVWGRTCESLIANPRSWLEAIHPEDRPRVNSAAHSSQSTGDYNLEYRIVRPDGTVRWVHDRAFPIKDADGRVYRIAGVAEDITAKRQLEDQLRQAQKMESLGTLAGGIAHDFNNILTGVLGSAEVVKLELPPDHSAIPWLQNITQAGIRARDLIQQIMTFGRKHESEMIPRRLQTVVGEALRLLRSSIPTMVQIDGRIDPNCPPVVADDTQIHQVVMNLCTNAWHALPEQGGRLEVSLAPVDVTAEMAATRLGLTAGPYVLLTVRDNGRGMPPEILARIFEPFFTTKKQGHGTGLGLAVVHGIVQSHHGAIFVQSTPGAGTLFEVFLPALSTPDAAGATPVETACERGQGESILLVDDDATALAGLRIQLEHLGYRVTAVSDPRSALMRFLSDPGRFNLILTDYAMAEFSGHDLAAKVLAARPGMPVFLASGLIESAQVQKSRAIGVREILRKPVPLTELARLLALHLRPHRTHKP